MTSSAKLPAESTAVAVHGDSIHIDGLIVEDSTLASLLRREPEEQWPAVVARALGVGARGLASMGLGVDLDEVDLRMERSVRRLTDEAQNQVSRVLDTARKGFREELDPEIRSSVMARSLQEFQRWQGEFLHSMDPSQSDSHTGRLVASLGELVGPGGLLESKVTELFDPASDTSGLGLLTALVDERFAEMRDLLMKAEGAAAEAERGTQKGFAYEDRVEEALRLAATRLPGAYVERTSTETGSLDASSKVGDFVITTDAGHRIVVEAKNVSSLAVHGKSGVLSELDLAMANRRASFGICVSAQDAFPTEVGSFRSDGHRLLIVDDGDGLMLEVALQWAVATLVAEASVTPSFDISMVRERLARLRSLARQFSNTQRSLTKISSSVTSVQTDLAEMRAELLAAADEIALELSRASSDGDGDARADVFDLRPAAGAS